jgi:hypothetical protein
MSPFRVISGGYLANTSVYPDDTRPDAPFLYNIRVILIYSVYTWTILWRVSVAVSAILIMVGDTTLPLLLRCNKDYRLSTLQCTTQVRRIDRF